jgi:cellulose synthase/poly-beta-1,6-N-acetylglucosamine synthase-like glycosyltransferase
MHTAATVFLAVTLPLFVLGLLKLAFYPLSLAFEIRRRRRPPRSLGDELPLVSVVVPAYNEARVVAKCIESILADEYPRKELILVDDGSSDHTHAVMSWYADHPDVTVVSQPNGGKAAALNNGIALARGDILVFVDADGIFAPDTLTQLLRGFDDERVGAVCGNDEPVNLDRLQTKLLTLLTHVGTGFVRRALALVNCLPIVSGNLGAFRRSALEEAGGFREGLLGEDLELTWRVHAAGYSVNFSPQARVYAEVPSTLPGLWRQRVRWVRGLIEATRMHWDMMGNRRYGAFGWYLPINVTWMLLVPIVQVLAIALTPVLLLSGAGAAPTTAMAVIGLLGLATALVATLYSIALDRAWRDLRYLYVFPLVVPFSVLMSLVTVWACVLEVRGANRAWNKLDRTGVVSRSVTG